MQPKQCFPHLHTVPLALVGYMYSILSRDIDNDFVLISTECDAFEEERMQLRKENDALLKGIQSLHGLLAQKEEHIELARYIIQKLRGQAKETSENKQLSTTTHSNSSLCGKRTRESVATKWR